MARDLEILGVVAVVVMAAEVVVLVVVVVVVVLGMVALFDGGNTLSVL